MSRHMSTILQAFTGNTDSYIKDSRQFVQRLASLQILPDEVMVSFDVTSLFTNVPVDESLAIITTLINDAELPKAYIDWTTCCLKSGYFLWRGEYYLQIDGVAMGSPIAPVVANIFMEWFEEVAMRNAPVKPRLWWRYVDDVFAVVAKDALIPFTHHLNAVHHKVQFTVEEERDGRLSFLDVLVIREPNGTVSHTVYRKPTHTDHYLRADSHHHNSQLSSVPRSLINRALALCEPKYVQDELDHLKQILEYNGYKWRQCSRWAMGTERKKITSVDRVPAYLPFVKGVTDKIGHLLKRKYDIRTFYRPPGQLRHFLRSPKDREPLNTPGVYQIPCECGSSYIGETRRNITTRLAEHVRSVKNLDVTKSAVAEHSQLPCHFLRFDKASVLAKERFLVPRKVREAIEINRHANFNRDRGWNLAAAWKPVLNIQHAQVAADIRAQDVISAACSGYSVPSSDRDSDEESITLPFGRSGNNSDGTISARAARAEARQAGRSRATASTASRARADASAAMYSGTDACPRRS